MKNFSLLAILLTTLFLSACATATPQSTPQPVTATETFTQPTQTEPPLETAIPLPTQSTAVENSTSVSFTNNINPILQNSCAGCHGQQRIRAGLNMTTYENLMAGSENGAVIIPNNANESLLVQLIQEGKMPNRGPALSPEKIQMIVDWINQGALNN